jgi:hypothetical protein
MRLARPEQLMIASALKREHSDFSIVRRSDSISSVTRCTPLSHTRDVSQCVVLSVSIAGARIS